jgi:hypothetical protein
LGRLLDAELLGGKLTAKLGNDELAEAWQLKTVGEGEGLDCNLGRGDTRIFI